MIDLLNWIAAHHQEAVGVGIFLLLSLWCICEVIDRALKAKVIEIVAKREKQQEK